MVRRFDPSVPVEMEVVHDLVTLAVRAPSAGFSQGWDFVALLAPHDRAAFWAAADDGGPADAWLRGVSAAPALVLCLSDPGVYLDLKIQAPHELQVGVLDDRIDVAIGAFASPMNGLLSHALHREQHWLYCSDMHPLGIPEDRRLVGVIALGAPATRAARTGGSPRTRPRRPLGDVLHEGRFGGWSGASA